MGVVARLTHDRVPSEPNARLRAPQGLWRASAVDILETWGEEGPPVLVAEIGGHDHLLPRPALEKAQ